MMKDQITTRDYELISAYLDNQLSERERAHLETRLKSDMALREELHEISKTRMLLQGLPKLRAPRNYFIQADTIPSRPTLRLAPVFGIVSAVASVLFALVIFSSMFFSSTPQVAMAPAYEQPVETVNVQREIQPSEPISSTPTEEAPMAAMQIPQSATSTPYIGELITGEPELPTPTTIYLFAMPPTSTPESSATPVEKQNEISNIPCDQVYDSGVYPSYTLPDYCASPTPSVSPSSTHAQTIQDISATPSPTDTVTTTATSTPTASVTPSPSATTTPTPTDTPTPTLNPTPTPTEIAPSFEKGVPTVGAESPESLAVPGQIEGVSNPTPSVTEQVVSEIRTTNMSFLNYLLLTVEISLASIAIIAGIIAIFFRIRTGR